MPYTQAERMSRVFSPLGPDALLLQRMAAHESVSGLFRYELDLISESEELAFAQIVGKPLAVSVRLKNGSERWFHGIVARFEHGAASERFITYRAELVPWLWLLTRRANCRIFQHQSVPDIARVIFAELGFSDFRFELTGTHPQREYTVQYRETDFNFVSRLFEDVGISYFFEHEEKAHTLVAFDSPGANAACPGQPTAIYSTGTGSAGAPAGEVRNLCFERELRPGAYALTDFNFRQPSLSLLTGTSSSACVGSAPRFEVYDYPGDFALPGQAESRVKSRIEAEECASVRVRGVSHCAAFTPGYRFDLRGHYRRDCNDAYLITEVTHFVTDGIADESGDLASYDNQFGCIPHSVPYRPQRLTARPVVHGVQTATVVGAAGKEIDVDEHARVVLQFHWDREGKRDDKSSCRVRVAQNWAGKGWGLIAHPRIGQEVIVEFLEGDPDRPIVTGRVYNAEQPPPYGLPGNSTQSGLKSRSSPGGTPANFNEIRFEDRKGDEHLYVQAEKDRTTLTKHDDTQNVGRNRTRTVGAAESVTVGADRTKHIVGNETVSIDRFSAETVGLAKALTIGAGYQVSVGALMNETVAGARINEVGAYRMETVAAYKTTKVGEKLSIDAGEQISIESGKSTVTMKKDGAIELSGTDVTLKTAGGTIHIDAGGIITIKGAMVKINT